ncbi:hypothetical protein TI03_01705 [Achromatium sp. WMS1]|nr:hypothetical protein TI03_01705 [Achromatium sp. WMS1]
MNTTGNFLQSFDQPDDELDKIEVIGANSAKDIIMDFMLSVASEGYRSKNQDAWGVWKHSGTVIALADGVGGISDGDVAAKDFVKQISYYAEKIRTKEEWMEILYGIDHQIFMGETTGIVVQLKFGKIVGASVGDSSAKIFDFDTVIDLTEDQQRRPLMGSGKANPIGFEHPYKTGFLILGSDGFFNYVQEKEIMSSISSSKLHVMDAARALLNKARLKDGELWDDTTVIIGEWTRQY